jgi:hypothetical protein
MGRTPSLCLVALLCALALSLAGLAVPAEAEDVCPLGAMRPDSWVAVRPLRSHSSPTSRHWSLKSLNHDHQSNLLFFLLVQDLVARLRSIGMIADRVAYLKQAVLNDTRSFTGKQIGSILGTITLQRYTLEVRAAFSFK